MEDPNSVTALFNSVRPDQWRNDHEFSQDIREVHSAMFAPAASESDIIAALNGWLQRHQPCLFGKHAAKEGLISFCILKDDDLRQEDGHIGRKIQEARERWLEEAFWGRKSAFVILAVSERLAWAEPSSEMLQLAKRLCSLYLLRELEKDAVILDEIFLCKPGQHMVMWRWDVGANYFAAHGDGRWWHDHRIPGGIGFSMNSVGHLVKSALLAQGMKIVEEKTDAPAEQWDAGKFDSPETALRLAMQTIAAAQQTRSGPATRLLPLPPPEQLPIPECPFKLAGSLAEKNFCTYEGYYHTDYTIPSEYFVPDVDRSEAVKPFELDFTYLFHKNINNPAHDTMFLGRRIKSASGASDGQNDPSKLGKIQGELVRTDANPIIQRLLSRS